MAKLKKKRNPVVAVIFFLMLLGAVFILAVVSLISPSKSIIKGAFSESKVALVRLEGVIMDGQAIIDEIGKWADDKSVKAIVLRIVSPGGVVTPSQEIFLAVKRASEKKPVIASMGSVAASGGYYIAAACDKIIANSGTITGSIGVIMMFSNTEKLMDKIGLGTIVVKSGKFKDTGSPNRPFTEEDRKIMQAIVDDTYDQFITDAAEGREMDVEEMRKLADGRIYTGRQAKDLNLVDELGDLQDAIMAAGKMAGIEGEPDVVEDVPGVGLLERLFGDKFEVKLPGRLSLPAGIYFLWPAW